MTQKTGGWWQQLKKGLSRSSERLSDGLKTIFTHRKLDQDMLDELEEILIAADLGVTTAAKLTQELATQRLNQDITPDEVKLFLAEHIATLLEPVAQPLTINPNHHPHVVLVVGVNGSGKTTTLGKLAKQWLEQGLKVQLVAGDTFRAAAVQQLQIWGERLSVPVHSGPAGCDAAGLVYDALVAAQKENVDVLAVDTAGRLHNKADLMAELEKIRRVMAKLDPTAPHTTLLVLDATIGQNAQIQVQTFQDLVKISGLVLTKLDGTAKGGVIVAIAEKTHLPIHAVGVGESADDLRPFTAQDFAYNLLGINLEK